MVETYDLSTIEEPVIASVAFLSFDSKDNMYFFDRRQMKLISLDTKGNLRWATGQEGKGPGDFETPLGMAVHNDMIYVVNVMGARVDEFDLQGNFIQSFNIPEEIRFGRLAAIRDNGELIMNSAKFGTIGTQINVLNLADSLELVNSFSIIETEEDEYERATSSGSVALHNDQLIYTYATSNGHRFYELDSTLTAEVTREFEGTLGPGVYMSGNSVSLYSLGGIGAPVFLDNGNYMLNIRYPSNIDDPNAYAKRASTGETEAPVYEEVIDLYNSDHELLYVYDDTEEIEAIGNLRVRDSEGYYYSTFSDELMIKKFRIGME